MHVGALAGVGQIRECMCPVLPQTPGSRNRKSKPYKALNPKSQSTPHFLNSFGKRAETATSTGAASRSAGSRFRDTEALARRSLEVLGFRSFEGS